MTLESFYFNGMAITLGYLISDYLKKCEPLQGDEWIFLPIAAIMWPVFWGLLAWITIEEWVIKDPE